jgi:hypothetical protein
MGIHLVKLTRGLVAVVSLEYARVVDRHKWPAVKAAHSFYAATWIKENGKWCKVYLHRLILGCNEKEQGHHKDGYTLNNLTSNLEKCSQKKNLSYRKY